MLKYLLCFFIFQIHLEDVSTSETGHNFTKKKYCNYRSEKNYIYDDFKMWAGYGCYIYSNRDVFFNFIYNVSLIFNKEDKVPAIKLDGGVRIPFDYKNSTVHDLMRDSFREEKFFKKWLDCCKQADDCCVNRMTNENIKTSCSMVWDGWSCFDPGIPGTNSTTYCPSYIHTGDAPCIQTAYKECFINGTWNPITDYTTCSYTQIIRIRHEFHVYCLFAAILISLPAIIIFYVYRQLWITRVILHRSLLIAIVLKNVLMILSKVLITLDALQSQDDDGHSRVTNLEANGVPCRVLAFFERVSINSMYACMLVDGFYLHRIIVTVFKKDPPLIWLYSVVGALSFIPVIIWASLKATQTDKFCWIVDEKWYFWIIDGSRYAMLGINLILLLDIIRVLVWKLKKNNKSQHTKSTLRATFILLPLFGIQFIMMSQRPQNAICEWDQVFYYVSFFVDSSQGPLVALLYCYFNKEVQILLKKSYLKWKSKFFSNLDEFKPNFRRSTTATYLSRRDTR